MSNLYELIYTTDHPDDPWSKFMQTRMVRSS